MNIGQVAQRLIALADSVNEYLPAQGATQAGIDLAHKVADMIDGLKDEIPADQQAQAQSVRARLAERVTLKSTNLSKRLRGKE
jgi:hypothetical protein